VALSGGSQKAIEDGQRTLGHEVPQSDRFSGTNRQQAPGASKITLQSIAPDTKIIALNLVASCD
jgi:hypothetical protein